MPVIAESLSLLLQTAASCNLLRNSDQVSLAHACDVTIWKDMLVFSDLRAQLINL